jgi:short-subunit dehydrogenase
VNDRKKIVIVGATSLIAEHCARLWVANYLVELILVGRDVGRTEQIAADLRVRGPQSSIRVLEADFADPARIGELVNEIASERAIDIVLIAHGSLPDQVRCQEDLMTVRDALFVNGLSPVLFAEAFVNHMQAANHGTLALIGSVAGDRGRKSNYVYGAAKGLVTRYAEGLQHRLANTNVKVVLVKPGPTSTPMTAHLARQGHPMARAEDVARAIVRAIDKGQLVVYAPAKWALIMLVVRHLPWKLFRKLNI